VDISIDVLIVVIVLNVIQQVLVMYIKLQVKSMLSLEVGCVLVYPWIVLKQIVKIFGRHGLLHIMERKYQQLDQFLLIDNFFYLVMYVTMEQLLQFGQDIYQENVKSILHQQLNIQV
jgi:hypothetical protein